MLNKEYTANVWGISILGSPILVIAYFATAEFPEINFNLGFLSFLMVCIPMSLFILMPTILVFYLAFNNLTKRNISSGFQKTILAFVGVSGIFFTYCLMVPGRMPSLFDLHLEIFPICYSLMVAITSLAFKIKIPVSN